MNRILLLAVLFAGISIPSKGQGLKETAIAKMMFLQTKIDEAEQKGINVLKEKIALRTAEIFLEFADWDERNVAKNTRYFELGWHYRDSAEETAEYLPRFERLDVIEMLDASIATLVQLTDCEISRSTTPNIDWAQVKQDGDHMSFEGKPVFLADWTWKPNTPKLEEFHGQLDGVFITPSYVLNEAGDINSGQMSALTAKGGGTAGFVFINHRDVPQWAVDKYGADFELKDAGGVRYTEYDIDHPGAEEMIGALIHGMVPQMSGKRFTELGYMLCNEPHFIHSKKADGTINWASSGVSEYTMDSLAVWLKEKHETIATLNAVWHTAYGSFDEVQLEVPISESLQGSPQWYDWSRFNMDRVTRWYQFVADTVKGCDPLAKVHLKLIPGMWTNNARDHGLDFEALTKLSDIIGNDTGAEHRSYPWKTDPWEAKYKFDWREMAMAHDFFKSVSPDKLMFNTESHYLSTKASLDLELDPMHARATYWLAHTQGMSASQTWYWARTEDGDKRSGDDAGYGGSNNHQPRVVNELHATLADLNAHSERIMHFQRQRKPVRIFYSEASAINTSTYLDDVFDLYESMYFDGVPLGFVTKDILEQQDHSNWDVVLVYKTQHVTQQGLEALQAYVDAGGSVIMDAESLTKDEYGRSLTGITGANLMDNVEDMRVSALQIVKSTGGAPRVTLIESSNADFPICTWKSFENEEGNQVISVVNVGRVNAEVSLKLNDASEGTTCHDILRGVDVPNTLTLKPYDVMFLELRTEKSKVLE
ncbi:alpha-amylase family protein [Reichenbachiella agariperforans]|uniref:alpha-amylase family protein n=1 Tax=Reichenbachiella agariperforans TaxID=156994 RepID=UPI001C08F63F|nr:alpha-amylase family protein [Reichenbachiella agariperforans]MBU2912767.1 beta-galactosidase [Reichenbachiella agariperforans]